MLEQFTLNEYNRERQEARNHPQFNEVKQFATDNSIQPSRWSYRKAAIDIMVDGFEKSRSDPLSAIVQAWANAQTANWDLSYGCGRFVGLCNEILQL
jgi:hypothetical protein